MEQIPILMADDDADDRMLTQDALYESRLKNPLYFVKDGQELLDFLYNRGAFQDREQFPRPGLILLDLNMPNISGREALQKIKQDPDLRRIPIVVLTTSQAEADIWGTYDLGANSFITKPVEFDKLVRVLQVIGEYWFTIVRLPET